MAGGLLCRGFVNGYRGGPDSPPSLVRHYTATGANLLRQYQNSRLRAVNRPYVLHYPDV